MGKNICPFPLIILHSHFPYQAVFLAQKLWYVNCAWTSSAQNSFPIHFKWDGWSIVAFVDVSVFSCLQVIMAGEKWSCQDSNLKHRSLNLYCQEYRCHWNSVKTPIFHNGFGFPPLCNHQQNGTWRVVHFVAERGVYTRGVCVNT